MLINNTQVLLSFLNSYSNLASFTINTGRPWDNVSVMCSSSLCKSKSKRNYTTASSKAKKTKVAKWEHLREDVNHLLLEVSKSGLEATFRDKKLNDIAKEILAISKQGLLSRQLGEEQYLLPLERIVDTGRNVAQIMLDKYYNEWQENVSPVFEEYKL